ncbi:MAG: hypothetical protein AB1626_05910, partial [Candidatus Micrarchaeota archaeon]
MYAEDEEGGFPLKYIIVIGVVAVALVAFFALTPKAPIEQPRPNVSVAPNASVVPSVTPLPFPSFGFEHTYTNPSSYVGEPVEVKQSIESSEDGYRDEFSVQNK